MRPLSLALILAVCLGGMASAAPTKKKSAASPPTAQADATLVAPDPTPPPPTYALTSRTVEMAPIGSVGKAASVPPRVAAAAPAPVAAQPPPAPALPPEAAAVAHAEACLRTEAPRAARAEAGVKLAVDLLLEDLCGGEVDRAALYVHNIEALARFNPQSERTAAGLSGARVDPETGEILNPPAGDVTGALTASGFSPGDLTVPPQMRKFAAELVLAAKAEASSKSEPRRAH